jgi:hypothetical protein
VLVCASESRHVCCHTYLSWLKCIAENFISGITLTHTLDCGSLPPKAVKIALKTRDHVGLPGETLSIHLPDGVELGGHHLSTD